MDDPTDGGCEAVLLFVLQLLFSSLLILLPIFIAVRIPFPNLPLWVLFCSWNGQNYIHSMYYYHSVGLLYPCRAVLCITAGVRGWSMDLVG